MSAIRLPFPFDAGLSRSWLSAMKGPANKGLARSLMSQIREARRRRNLHVSAPPSSTHAADTPTIYFLTPDCHEPTGGVQVIYRHVDILNQAGLKALVVHQRKGFRCSWFANETAVASVDAVCVRPGDVFVVPELFVGVLAELPKGVRQVIFNQGVHLTWSGLTSDVRRFYLDNPDLVAIVTVSEHSLNLLRYAFPGVDVHLARPAIDRSLFHPGATGDRKNTIGFMPRRMTNDIRLVREMLENRGAPGDWEFVPLEGLSHAAVGDRLRTTKIFLSFTYQEGFGLPVAEAMACGNHVIGYHGYGGGELFNPRFSQAIDAGDVVGFAKAVEHAVASEAREPGWCQRKGAAASAFIEENYSIEKERSRVERLYRELLPSRPTTKSVSDRQLECHE